MRSATRRRLAAGFALAAACGLAAAAQSPSPGRLPLSTLTLPPGFSISVYADNVPNARSMTLGPRGTLFVGIRTAGNVYAILDANKDQQADRVVTLATGLEMPNGVAWTSPKDSMAGRPAGRATSRTLRSLSPARRLKNGSRSCA